VEAVFAVSHALASWTLLQASKAACTYRLQSSSTEQSLDSRLYTASVPMQVPYDCSSVQLRVHLGYCFDVLGVDLTSSIATRRL
jgi:hypothetical protein